MTTAELMALAVLKGDLDAAAQLADLLLENRNETSRQLPPVTRLTADAGGLRVIAYVAAGAVVMAAGIEEAVRRWLAGQELALILSGIDRVELYEIPEAKFGVPMTQEEFNRSLRNHDTPPS